MISAKLGKISAHHIAGPVNCQLILFKHNKKSAGGNFITIYFPKKPE
jgi:hypothetical protein